MLLNIFTSRKSKNKDSEIWDSGTHVLGDSQDSGILLDKISDSGVSLDNYNLERNLEDTKIYADDTIIISIPKKSIFDEAKSRFKNINKKNIEEKIEDFMRNVVFSSEDCYYQDSHKMGKIINYFDKLSKSNIDQNTLQLIESTKTILLHLEEYLSKESNFGFKSYLFGKTGVLTRKRLDDMNRINNSLKNFNGKIIAQKNYVFSRGDKENEKFNLFNVSYSEKSGKKFVNINDNSSKGMYTDHGRLHWGSLDRMFEGEMNVRSTITNSIKEFMNYSSQFGNLTKIKGHDWKKNKLMDYFKLSI